jgi:peptide methionine sulfoxide reductase MsrB
MSVLPAQGQAGTEAERDATETAEAVHKQDAETTSARGRTEKVFSQKEWNKMTTIIYKCLKCEAEIPDGTEHKCPSETFHVSRAYLDNMRIQTIEDVVHWLRHDAKTGISNIDLANELREWAKKK